ncbi:MAG: NADPH-dependent 7-cyano-7-deazaguanine reductase QueF [Lentisphaerae bacterium]|nr:NADPH-dependent 7-cyano-7-deazaguanine reductase QueF [Lentisphaerota bacterium]
MKPIQRRPARSSEPYSELTLLNRGERRYPDSPDRARLETFPNPQPRRDYWIRFDCPEFTALCPVTAQPDFGRLEIDYSPRRRCVESKSLKLYLFSFRNQGVFHEAVVNRILDDLVGACRPRKARVTGRFNARGGIAITVTAEYP